MKGEMWMKEKKFACKNMMFSLFLFCVILPVSSFSLDAQISEDFSDLSNWEPVSFDKIGRHSEYVLREEDDGSRYLQILSNNSASGIRHVMEFNPHELPFVSWEWKVLKGITKGDPTKKSGDDYPVRLYIMFPYNPEEASFFESVKYSAYKALKGVYPPKASLNYAWTTVDVSEHSFPNPYTSKAHVITLRAAEDPLDTWVSEEVDILEDYRRIFGKSVPDAATLAIMGDSDDTGEETEAAIRNIKVKRSRFNSK
jgi:hypothetical protein